MQQVIAQPQFLLETSICMTNIDRIGEGVWTTGICQDILRQTQILCHDLINAAVIHYGDGSKIDEKKDVQLTMIALRETLKPFMVKWQSVFFHKDQKPRSRVRRKHRREMQKDFSSINEVIFDLVNDMEQCRQSKPKPKKNAGGIN